MAVSKLDVAVVIVVAVVLLRVEYDHRIVIAAPAQAPQAAAVCPDTDDVPFSADCIRFIEGGALPQSRGQSSGPATLPDPGVGSAPHACPASNENAPYSASCIKFLSGWYWQADPTADAH